MVGLSFAGAASAQQVQATPKTLGARIAAAKNGETIVLAPGDYGPLYIFGPKLKGAGVVIQPKPGARVVFTLVDIAGAQGITLKDVEVDIEKETFGVTVESASDHITLSGLNIHTAPGKWLNGMLVRNSTYVTVEDCKLSALGTGINMVDSDHLQILRNNLSNIESDSIRGASSHVDVIGNHATDFHPMPGDHPDFIQFWSTKQSADDFPTGNRVMDNVFERGQGEAVQGVFIADNNDILISGNALLGTMYNAISLAEVHGAVVENNFIQSYPDMGAKIITRAKSTDVTVRNNISSTVENFVGDGANPGYKQQGNRSIPTARPGDRSALDAWLAKRQQQQQQPPPAQPQQ